MDRNMVLVGLVVVVWGGEVPRGVSGLAQTLVLANQQAHVGGRRCGFLARQVQRVKSDLSEKWLVGLTGRTRILATQALGARDKMDRARRSAPKNIGSMNVCLFDDFKCSV